ncbi:MAG: hypothetical protein QXM16_06730 [Nitrososphaerota archaeon]
MKLRLTGAVAFSAALYAQLIGILFSVLIARKLSTTEFGLWAYVGSLVSYSLMPVALVGGWIARDAARGEKVMYPSLMVSFSLIAAGLTIYIALSTVTHSQIGVGLTILLAGLLIFVPNALANIATAIASGYTPHHVGVGSMLFETVKLVSAFTLVVFLGISSLPFVFGSIALSDYILSIVNPVYSSAWMAASLMTLNYFIGIFMGMYNTLIIGTEQFDLDRVPAVREYLKSRLALRVHVNAYTGPLYLSLLAVMLLLSRDAGINMQATSISAAKLIREVGGD